MTSSSVYFSFYILTILLSAKAFETIRVESQQSQCEWQNHKCTLLCFNTTMQQVNRIVEIKMAEDGRLWPCTYNQATLLFVNITFKNDVIKPTWYNVADILLKDLTLNLPTVTAVQSNLFPIRFFKYLKYLTICNLKTDHLDRDTFNDLRTLKELAVFNMSVKWVSAELLWPMNNSLTNLSVNLVSEINLYNWTGSVKLPALNRLEIKNSRIYTVENNSLQGLSNCTHLIFNNCSIESVSAGSFRTTSSTLVFIDLRNNLLATLCSGFFTEYLSKPVMFIYLSQNPWNCCILSANFIESVNENSGIFDVTMCLDSSTTKTTQTTSASITVSTTSTTGENYPVTTSKLVQTTKTPNASISLNSESLTIFLAFIFLRMGY